MGDIANMTSVYGEVSGPRLLRLLRSWQQIAGDAEAEARAAGEPFRIAYHAGRRQLLEEMADDLEAELTPPDYPDDDGDAVDLGEPDTGPCEGCGRLADRVPVRDNGRVWFACPGCARRVSDDTVDLDDPAFPGRPEQE